MAKAYINLYKQGWYHRSGKLNTLSIHPGDMYPDPLKAALDIDTEAPYVATVEVDLGDIPFEVFTEDNPVPLRESRKWFAKSTTEDMIEWDPTTPGNLPITRPAQPGEFGVPGHIVGMRPLAEPAPAPTAFEARYAAVDDHGDDYSGPSYEEWKRSQDAVPTTSCPFAYPAAEEWENLMDKQS